MAIHIMEDGGFDVAEAIASGATRELRKMGLRRKNIDMIVLCIF